MESAHRSLSSHDRIQKYGGTGRRSRSRVQVNLRAKLGGVAALRQIGGYSPWFWLDNSDAWLFRQLHAYGKRVYVAGELVLQHDFSMQNMNERISSERYETILLAESGFWDSERNGLAGGERTLRLAGRMIKHYIRGDSSALRRLTQRALIHRLFRSRAYRLNLWRQHTAARLGSALRPWQKPKQPMISVCMAAYGGERYIEAQLYSIIPQLGDGDEIVIIDDASPDNSALRIQAIQDELAGKSGVPTIRLLRHSANRGLVATFEDAIRNATGDILFLADDDDLWAPNKVSKVLSIFSSRPEVQLIATNLSLIDQYEKPFSDPILLRHRRFNTEVTSNIRYFGVPGNRHALAHFCYTVTNLWHRALYRRSQHDQRARCRKPCKRTPASLNQNTLVPQKRLNAFLNYRC